MRNKKHNDLRTDDIDNLTNRRVRSVGELVENQLRIGMVRVEKTILKKSIQLKLIPLCHKA